MKVLEDQDAKVMVFTWDITAAKCLAAAFGDVDHLVYHGGLDGSEKNDVIKMWTASHGPRVLICTGE